MDSVPGIVVVGGGWAGLSCASALAERGLPVTLLEERGHFGGRACSFPDAATGDEVDNGQHIFMSCFRDALRFLERIGMKDGIRFQSRLEVPLAEPSGRRSAFRCPRLPPPFHLLGGVLGHRGLGWRDKVQLLLAWRRMRAEIGQQGGGSREEAASSDFTVEAWLDSYRQTPGSRRGFWHPLAVAALNEDPSRASGRLFTAVLRRSLLEGPAGSRLGIPRVPLCRLVDPAVRLYLEGRRGRVLLNAPVSRLVLEGGVVRSVRLRDGSEIRASAVVIAVPPNALARLLPTGIPEADAWFGQARRMLPSPILSIHLWYDRPVLEVPFLGLLDSPIHWIFDARRGGEIGQAPSRVALVASGARDLVDRSGTDLLELAAGEMRRYLPRARAAILLHSRVIKERQATYSLPQGACAMRPGQVASISNLFLAGDWTDTGLPGTLESAAASGHRCAESLEDRIHRAA